MWLATTSLSLTSMAPALAQPAPGGQGGDPPAIAGRLSQIAGSVSLHSATEQSWSAAALNYPVTSGEGFWTEQQAGATIEIGADQLVMDGGTELEVGTLDQQQFAMTTPQGAVFLQLPQLPDGGGVTVNTPRAAVQITAAGRYEIVAGDTNDPTTVTVVEGAAHVGGTGVSMDVGPNQTATITGAESFQGSVGPMQTDGFLQAQLSKAAPQTAGVPRQVQCMTGGADLAQYGSWSQTSQYGQVWYPNDVPSGWAPYRDGHWAYVAPWGWSWVDAQPWGFAPFHYGRWVQDGGRWGWVAAAPDAPFEPYPVYAPAEVSFLDVGGAALAGFAAGALIGGAIGWVPLGFREPYYPSYHVSDGYLQRINRISVVNVRNITVNNYRNIAVDHFANARAAIVMPARDMARSVRVAGIARPLPAAALAGARPVVGRGPVAAAPRRAGPPAPGPRIEPAAAGRRPALRAAAPAPDVRPAAPRGPDRGARPGLPALRAPGEGRPAVPARAPLGAPGRLPGEHAPGAEPRAVQPEPLTHAPPIDRAAPSVARPAPGFEPHAPAPEHRAPDARAPAMRASEPRAPEHILPEHILPEHMAPEHMAPEHMAPEHMAPEHMAAAHRAPGMPHVQRPTEPVARPAYRAEPRPVARPEPRPEARPHPEAAPRPAPHPEPRPAPHPAPHPEGEHRR
jgi:hypothetical protein